MCLYTGTNKLNETTQIANLHSEDSKFVSMQFQDSENSGGRSPVIQKQLLTFLKLKHYLINPHLCFVLHELQKGKTSKECKYGCKRY